MIQIFAADDPLVLNGTYDIFGWKPGEQNRVAKARARIAEHERRRQMEVVVLPRAVHAKYSQFPWSELVAAAERRVDGLRLVDFPAKKDGAATSGVPVWQPKSEDGKVIPGWEDWDSIALMRQAEKLNGEARDLAWLFKRNWNPEG